MAKGIPSGPPLPAPLGEVQRPPAEVKFQDELERLAQLPENEARPKGWQLSPKNVLRFILGDETLKIKKKYVGSVAAIQRCIVSLATNRGLMLIGEPGTAKSWLSELLAAAISGDSSLTIQGSAGTSEEQIKYSWNYALLLHEGPSERALVPSPLHLGMSNGQIVRFEEITRCPLEIQDSLLSVLSERVLMIPEFEGKHRVLHAQNGFNLIATANTRDRGIHEMSSALKRRFNFETLKSIEDPEEEIQLVEEQTNEALERSGFNTRINHKTSQLLVDTFRELRHARTREGHSLEPLTTLLSTAEAISTAISAGFHASFYDAEEIEPKHLLQHLISSAIKDHPEDLQRVKHYFQHYVQKRKDPISQSMYKEMQQFENSPSTP